MPNLECVKHPLSADVCIKVQIVGDLRIHRDSLAQALGAHRELLIVGVSPLPRHGIEFSRWESPDVVLIEALAHNAVIVSLIARRFPSAKVVVYGVSDDAEDVVRWAEAGAAGYLTLSADLAKLVDTIASVMAGEFPCSPRLAAMLAKRLSSLATRQPHLAHAERLTGREQEVARLIDQGLSNKDIANALGIEVSTVKHHVHQILHKTRASRRWQAAALLRRQRPARPRRPDRGA